MKKLKAANTIADQALAQATKADPQTIEVQKSQERRIDELLKKSCKVTGTRSRETSDRIILQVAEALVWPKSKDAEDTLFKAFGAIDEMRPRNGTEAMLAAQMIAANDAALMFLKRATLEAQTMYGIDANVLRATRLMRVFGEQLDAMQKLKGKAGRQRVTVEHVHVHEGGQAIVGAVTTKRNRGRGDDNENQ